MATYCAGVLISDLRKQKGFSQEKLAEGICDRRTISYIESGKVSPGKYVYEKLMQRLGIEPGRFANYVSSNPELKFETVRLKISQLFKENKTDEICVLLNDLENDKQLRHNKFIRQFILKSRAWIISRDWKNTGDPSLLPMIDEAIGITLPNFDENNIGAGLYTLIEIDLIRMLGLMKLYNGKPADALIVFLELEKIILKGYLFTQDSAPIYCNLMVTTAKCLRWLNRLDEALAASNRGLEVCTDTRAYGVLPWLLYQKASALYLLGDKSEALNVMNDAIIISKNYRETEMIVFLEMRRADMFNPD